MPFLDSLLEGLNQAGSRLRYGVSPEEKWKKVLEQPEYQQPSRESDKTEAERRVSVELGSKSMLPTLLSAGIIPPQIGGPLAANGFNIAREGIQGLGALAAGKPFLTPGGVESNDPTPSDEDPTGGFNLRSVLTGLEASGITPKSTPSDALTASTPGARLLAGYQKQKEKQ